MPTTRVKNHLLTYHIPLIQILNFGIKVFAHVREIAPEKFFENVLCIRRIVLRKDFASLPIVFSQNKSLILRQKKKKDFENFHSKYFSNNYPIETFVEWLLCVDALHIAFSWYISATRYLPVIPASIILTSSRGSVYFIIRGYRSCLKVLLNLKPLGRERMDF